MKARDWIVRGVALVVVLVIGVTLPPYAYAQQVGEAGIDRDLTQGPLAGLKVAVIDGDRVIQESNIGIQVQQETQMAIEGWETRVLGKQAELDTLMAQAQNQQLTLTNEAMTRVQNTIEQLQVDLQRLQDDAQRALNRLAEQAQARINERLIPAVNQLASEAGYDLILDTRMQGILYFASAIDATDRYIALVNANNSPLQQED
jgi:outer membrane protein